MKKSQLNAISRSYQLKKYNNQRNVLVKYGLEEEYKKSGYKYLTSFLKKKYHEGVIQYWNEVYGD